ncbi:dentin sialophosphoprotein-like [Ptychodera flava]|uniref:dentin sialophosphoprotein-like n=1 Tax=Ptychodera flava TaxID=63121 RepID=UPI003969BEEF
MRMSEGSYLLSIIEELEDEEDSDSCHGSGRSTDEERSETAEDSQMTGRAQRDSTGDEDCTDQSSDLEQRSDTDADSDDRSDLDDEGQRSQLGDDSATEDTLAVKGDTISQTTIRDTNQTKVDFPDILKEHIRKAELIVQDAGDLSSEGNVKDDDFDKKAEKEAKVEVSRDYRGESQYAEIRTDRSKSEDVGDDALTKCVTELKSCDKKSLPDSSKPEKVKFEQSAGTRLISDDSRNNNNVAESGNESHLENEPHGRDEEKSQGDVFADDTGVAHVTFKWTDGGDSAFIAGDFTSWEESPLNYDENEKCFLGTFELSDGEHQYKYVVDGQWRLKSDEEDIHGPYGPNHVICIRNGKVVTD